MCWMSTVQIPPDLEVGFVPFSPLGTFPGLYLFSVSARMVRPVQQLFGEAPSIELIGPFEQVSFPTTLPLTLSPSLFHPPPGVPGYSVSGWLQFPWEPAIPPVPQLPLEPQRGVPLGHAQCGGLPHSLLWLQPEPQEHVPVPGGLQGEGLRVYGELRV